MKARAWNDQNDDGQGELNEDDEEQQRHRQRYEERPQFEDQLYDELHNDNEAIVGGERYALCVKAAAGRKDKGEEETNRDDVEQQGHKQRLEEEQHEEQLYDELQNDNEVIAGGERYVLHLVQKGWTR